MQYQKVEPSREGLDPLPNTDTLFLLEDGAYMRLRITAKTTEGQVRDTSPEPGVAESINLKLQCSVAKDASGDVREDQFGKHLLFAAEVHSVTLQHLVDDKISFDAWLTDRIDEMLVKAARKRVVRDEVLSVYKFAPDTSAPQ